MTMGAAEPLHSIHCVIGHMYSASDAGKMAAIRYVRPRDVEVTENMFRF